MKREFSWGKRGSERTPLKKKEEPPPRRAMGGKTLGAMLPHVTYVAFKKKSSVFMKIVMDWEYLVGQKIAQQTAPRRLNMGVLTIACSGPIAMEMRYHAPQILARINTSCGLYGTTSLLQELKLIQDLTLKPPPPPKIKKMRQNISIEAMENKALEEALARLGGAIAAREESKNQEE